MSSDTTDGRWFDVRMDIVGAVLALILAFALVPLRFLASQIYIVTLPLVLGFAAALYLLTTRSNRDELLPGMSRRLTRLLPSVAVFGMAAMVVVAVHQARSSLFYYVAVWTGIVILTQVVFGDERDFHAGLLLAQVVLFAAVIRLAGTYASPSYVGIDIFTHVDTWATAIADAHSLQPIDTEKYYASPLFHILVVQASQFLQLSLRQGLLLSVGIAMPLSILLVYATANLLVSTRWAVFAAAAFSMSGHVIEWGIHLIPTSLGLVFFLAILYALTRLLHMSYSPRDFFLVVLFSVATILTHQISSFIMLVLIGGGLVAKVLVTTGLLRPERPEALGQRARESVNLTGLLVFDLGLITFMWSLTPYHGSSFLETVFSYFRSTLATSAGFLNLAGGSSGGASSGSAAAAVPTFLEEVVAHVDAAAFLLMLLLTIVGSLYLLHRKRSSHAAFTSIAAIVIMLVFIFGFPLFGIRTFVPGRWFAFLAAPMAVIGAIGVGHIAEHSHRTVAVVVLLVFTLAFPATALVSSNGTLDDPAFDSVQTRYSYTEAELAAASTFADVTATGPENQLHSDHPYNTLLERAYGLSTDAALVRNASTSNRTVVYRQYDQSSAAYFQGANGMPHTPAISQQQLCLGRDVAYDNGQVTLCRSGVGPVRTTGN